MYWTELRIPKERTAVVIGKKGETKRAIERKTKTKIKISREGEVHIDAKDSYNTFIATPIIKAISRGFNPDIALLLAKDEYHLEIIDMRDFSKGSTTKLARIRARAIGTQGKARAMLEQLTNTHIAIHGRTTAILGKVEEVHIAKQAIEKLLGGSPHSNVYHFIEMQMQKLHE